MPKDRHVKLKLSARVSQVALNNLEHWRKHYNKSTLSEALEDLLQQIPDILKANYEIHIAEARMVRKSLEEEVMTRIALNPTFEWVGEGELFLEPNEEDIAIFKECAKKYGLIWTSDYDLLCKIINDLHIFQKTKKLLP